MTDKKVEDFLEHAGVLGMKWGVRKTPQETLETDRKNTKLKGAIIGGTFGALAGSTLLDLAAKNGPAPVKKKGLAYVMSLLKKTPPSVVPNPKNLNTATMAFRALSSSRYGKAVVALGAFTVAAAIGSKVAGSGFDKDQLDPTRIAAREANLQTTKALVQVMNDSTRKQVNK